MTHKHQFMCPSCHPWRPFIVILVAGPVVGAFAGAILGLLLPL